MKKRKRLTDIADFRHQAEERLQARGSALSSDADIQEFVHELEVRRIELELWNEKLNLSRTEAEARLERYTDLYDFAPVGYFTLQREGIILQVNLTGACLLGVERGQLVNRRFDLFIAEADRPDFNAFLERVFKSNVKEICEAMLLEKEGGPLWARFEALTFGDRQACRLVALDITERKRAERALGEAEEKMRSVFRAAPTGIGIMIDRVFLEVNQRFCDLTGYSRDELVDRSARMLYSNDADYEYVGREKYRQIAETGAGAVETRFRRKDGRMIDVLLSSALIDPADLSRGVTFTAWDITERKRAEEALQKRVEELAALNALGRMVNATLSLDQTVAAALQGILKTVHPDLACLFLCEGDRLIPKAALPSSALLWPIPMPEHRMGECLCGLAAREKKPLYSRNIFNDPRCVWEECKKAGVKSFAALPLSNGEEVIGVIGLASAMEQDYERQAGFLETMTGQVSIAVTNARLFELVQKELAERKKAEEAIREQMNELRRWHEATLGRETRVLDLKREVNELLVKAGRPPRYESAMTESGRNDRCSVSDNPKSRDE